MKKILTIQDISCYGSCSITVSLPILEHYGIECAILPSAILSTHTGFKNNTFFSLTSEMKKILNHFVSENIKFDCLYVGYIKEYEQFEIIDEAINKLLNNKIIFVDPAMADNGKLYRGLDSKIVLKMRKLITHANLILPNLTEACFLLDIKYKEKFEFSEIKDMLINLSNFGPNYVVITGIESNDLIYTYSYDKKNNNFNLNSVKREKKNYFGTGDLFTSLVISYLLNNIDFEEAIKKAMGFISQAIRQTLDDDEHFYATKYPLILKNESFLK